MSETHDMDDEISVLSTKLLEAVEKQTKLEEKLFQTTRELEFFKRKAETLEREISEKYIPKDIVEESEKKRKEAEDEVVKLRAEVEELTSSLFDEANTMVASANREKYKIEKKNEYLSFLLKEKDILLESLQQQLVGLRGVIQDMDDEKLEKVKETSNEKYAIIENSIQSTTTEHISGSTHLTSPSPSEGAFTETDSVISSKATETEPSESKKDDEDQESEDNDHFQECEDQTEHELKPSGTSD